MIDLNPTPDISQFVFYLDNRAGRSLYRHEGLWRYIQLFPREFGVQHFQKYLDEPAWKKPVDRELWPTFKRCKWIYPKGYVPS